MMEEAEQIARETEEFLDAQRRREKEKKEKKVLYKDDLQHQRQLKEEARVFEQQVNMDEDNRLDDFCLCDCLFDHDSPCCSLSLSYPCH